MGAGSWLFVGGGDETFSNKLWSAGQVILFSGLAAFVVERVATRMANRWWPSSGE
jgi:hypothetical protein